MQQTKWRPDVRLGSLTYYYVYYNAYGVADQCIATSHDMASSLRLGDLTLGEQAKPNGGNIDPPTMDTTKDNSSHDKAADELEWLSQSDYREVVGYPTWAWKKLNDVCPGKVQVKRVNERSLSSSGKCPPDTVRFVCISDTHSVSHNIDVPEGDVLIHAGDFTMEGRRFEVDSFVEFLRSLPHRHKVGASTRFNSVITEVTTWIVWV